MTVAIEERSVVTNRLLGAGRLEVGSDFGRVEVKNDVVEVTAIAGTDAYVPPNGGSAIDRLPGYRFQVPPGAWTVSARAKPQLTSTFDAAAFMLRTDNGSWAKLAFERAPDGRSMAVSVVTRDRSDDANGPVFEGGSLWLRACFSGSHYAFHISRDGQWWDLLRLFELGGQPTALDMVAQSPTGEGCVAEFDHVTLTQTCPTNFRDGS